MMLIGDLFILLLRESIRYRGVTGRLNSISVRIEAVSSIKKFLHVTSNIIKVYEIF